MVQYNQGYHYSFAFAFSSVQVLLLYVCVAQPLTNEINQMTVMLTFDPGGFAIPFDVDAIIQDLGFYLPQ